MNMFNVRPMLDPESANMHFLGATIAGVVLVATLVILFYFVGGQLSKPVQYQYLSSAGEWECFSVNGPNEKGEPDWSSCSAHDDEELSQMTVEKVYSMRLKAILESPPEGFLEAIPENVRWELRKQTDGL